MTHARHWAGSLAGDGGLKGFPGVRAICEIGEIDATNRTFADSADFGRPSEGRINAIAPMPQTRC
jgi:hypothetical protein